MLRCILAWVSVFFAWQVMDFVIHGQLLMSTYEATADLWRPEMKYGVLAVVTLIASVAFTSIYCLLVDRKEIKTGLIFGFLFGIATGVGMGYGTYATQPIPYNLAISWFLGATAEATVGGLIVGAILGGGKQKPMEASPSD